MHQYSIIRVLLVTLWFMQTSAHAAVGQPVPLSPPEALPGPQQESQELYPPATQPYPGSSIASSRGGTTPSTYNYPASREELEKAAQYCQQEVSELYTQQKQVERYRLPIFQRSIGDAQARCKKLEELAGVIKQADEQLYTYQQSIRQAQDALNAR